MSCDLLRITILLQLSILQDYPASSGKGPEPLFWAGSLALRVKITVSCLPERLNYCKVFKYMFVIYKCGCEPHTSSRATALRVGQPWNYHYTKRIKHVM